MSDTTVAVFVVLEDGPHALGRLLARCHGRGWTPVALQYVSNGGRCDVAMRLKVPNDRRGTQAQIRAQLGRLVEVQRVTIDELEGYARDGLATAMPRAPAESVAA